MHELSVAQYLIEAACEAAENEGSRRITRLNVRIGALSGIVNEALQFSFDLVADGTACEAAALNLENVAVSVHCRQCDAAHELPEPWRLVCPICGAPTPDVLAGRELELVSIEIETDAD